MSDHFWISFDTLFSARKYPSLLCDTQSNVACEVFTLSLENGSSTCPLEEGSPSSALGGESSIMTCNFAEVALMSTLSLILFSLPVNCSCQDPRTSSGIVHEVVRLRAKEKRKSNLDKKWSSLNRARRSL